jgi:hypothetical protein
MKSKHGKFRGGDRSLHDDVPVPATLVDSVLVFGALAGVNLLTMHGKQLSAAVLTQEPDWLWRNAYDFWAYGSIIAGAAAIAAVGSLKIRPSYLALGLTFVSVTFPFLAQCLSDGRSALILLLHVYTGAAASLVFFFRQNFSRKMGLEFWDRTVAMGIKAMRFGLIFYGAGVALLKFVSDGLKEGKDGFLTTLFYPTLVLFFSFLLWVVWIIVPAWERSVALRAKGHTASGNDENDGDPENPLDKTLSQKTG